MSTLPDALSDRFHPSLVKKNPKGQDYVSIDGYINRLNDVLGSRWGWHINSIEWRHDIMPQTRNGQKVLNARRRRGRHQLTVTPNHVKKVNWKA